MVQAYCGKTHTKVRMPSAGSRHSCLICSDGTAVASGYNGDGQCSLPVLEKGVTYRQVSAGTYHTVFLRSDGRAVACGYNDDGQCDLFALVWDRTYTRLLSVGATQSCSGSMTPP